MDAESLDLRIRGHRIACVDQRSRIQSPSQIMLIHHKDVEPHDDYDLSMLDNCLTLRQAKDCGLIASIIRPDRVIVEWC